MPVEIKSARKSLPLKYSAHTDLEWHQFEDTQKYLLYTSRKGKKNGKVNKTHAFTCATRKMHMSSNDLFHRKTAFLSLHRTIPVKHGRQPDQTTRHSAAALHKANKKNVIIETIWSPAHLSRLDSSPPIYRGSQNYRTLLRAVV